ncbi:olfactory receptor 6F1-like [Pelodiscus sinensis]|uniref:olfactory receptor 6F1-like n=1 Tax=Pelodiscus sinensis TaxID=13735 RepID=UPI0003C4CDCC|nr:olfactory receptor 6F1-like [Pelodiscus sinensis]XP_006122826.1 olfactory receptor 6F1-like [Pelodiscus sinensis]|eukprot:XP_006122825.1 olfactory receptor 6F1-like [Pelodiscus sinensis]
MAQQNHSAVTEFILLGFPGSPYLQISLFLIFLLMYIVTFLGNMAIIILVVTYRRLHTPMYFFLVNLSFLEICYTTTSAPKALAIFLGKSKTISLTGCLLQIYFGFSFGCTEYCLLSVMAYDRYLAICYPLRYSTIMNSSLSIQLAVGSWVSGFLVMALLLSLISQLSFCGPNIIDHFHCEKNSLIVLSCTDISIIQILDLALSVIVILGSCVITLLSYVYIISTVLKIPSRKGQQKALSTCSSHLAVVLLWYVSTILLFVKPSARHSLELTKTVNIINTIVTPLLNPFIYALRNKEMKEAMQNILRGR